MSSIPTTKEPSIPASVSVEGESPRLAAIDIGTNSIRCIIMEVDSGGDYRVLDDEKAMVRLGEGMLASGQISPAAEQRAREALKRMAQVIAGFGVEQIEAVATSAVRRAENGTTFLETIKQETSLQIRIIDGEEEAELAALSVRHNFAMGNTRFAMVDIGGGSAEVVTATGTAVESVQSLELGAVYLSEWLAGHDPLQEKELKRLRKHVRRGLKQHAVGDGLPVHCLIGSGGTVNNIGSMVMALRGEEFESVHRYEVLHSEVVHLRNMLERMDVAQRRQVSGLDPLRADIIVAGVTVIDELMRRFRTNLLRINHQGIREGLVLRSLVRRGLRSAEETPRHWRNSLLGFGRACRFDEQHALQVNRLARKILAAVTEAFPSGEDAPRLLEAAALLHDCGYFIAYDRHHKHSYHLIRHANLFGFTPRERELVANIARYHRKALPKLRHPNFGHLNPEDQKLVRRLAGILRLADGLDRRRNGCVKELHCHLREGCFALNPIGEVDLAVEVYGGLKKGDLFAEAFALKLQIRS